MVAITLSVLEVNHLEYTVLLQEFENMKNIDRKNMIFNDCHYVDRLGRQSFKLKSEIIETIFDH